MTAFSLLVAVLNYKGNRQRSEQLNFSGLRGRICSTFRQGHSYTDILQGKLFSSSFLSFPFVLHLPYFSSITFLPLLFLHPAITHSFNPSFLPPSFISTLHSPLISDKQLLFITYRLQFFSTAQIYPHTLCSHTDVH
jgi:hypothetical protein